MTNDVSAGELAAIGARAAALLSSNPGDARLYSLIGEVERRNASPEAAVDGFGRALMLARTEIHALQWMLPHALETGDFEGFLERLDTLFRRWPERIPDYAPLVPRVFADARAYEGLIRLLAQFPPWKSTLISRLSTDAATLSFAAQIIEDLAARGAPPTDGDISNVLNGLLEAGMPERAYRSFLMTLSPDQQLVTGNVHNGSFQLMPTGRPFDWQILSHPGVGFSFAGDGSDPKAGRLEMTFQNTPVRGLRVRQYLLLAPGHYSLALHAEARSAKLPKGLYWSVRCAGSNKRLAQLRIEEGSYADAELATRFEVPAGGCGLQLVDLTTKAIAESWYDRYAGTVAFSAVRIEDMSR